MMAERPQLRAERDQARISLRRVRLRVTKIVERLDQAARLGGEISHGPGQVIFGRNRTFRRIAVCRASVVPGERTSPGTQRDEILRTESPPGPGQRPGQG